LNYGGQDRIKLTDFIQDKFPKNPAAKLQTNNNGNNINKSPQNPTKRGNIILKLNKNLLYLCIINF